MYKIPLFNLRIQHQKIQNQINRAIKEVFESNQFVLGEHVSLFESEAAQFLNTRYALGVASGTDAILLSLAAVGVTRGDEVITSPDTFFGTVGPILHLGAKPVFADIDPQTYNIVPRLIARKISQKTKAILPVHLYGQCADMTAIKKLGREYGISIVEDGAQAFGALQDGRRAGTMGEVGAFSFYPSKNLGACGDGGLIASSQKKIIEKVRMLRVQGARQKYVHEIAGYNSRLDTIQAAILRVKLRRIDGWNQRRRERAGYYGRLLRSVKEITLPYVAPGQTPIYHLYVIRAKNRDRLIQFLRKRGIETGIYYPLPQHLQKAVSGYRKGDFPEAERVASETIALPMFPELTEAQQRFVARSIEKFYG